MADVCGVEPAVRLLGVGDEQTVARVLPQRSNRLQVQPVGAELQVRVETFRSSVRRRL